MASPKTKPEYIAAGTKYRHLRESLKIQRVPFALMLRLGSTSLEAKEIGRVSFRPEEVQRLREVVRDHLGSSLEAYRETFGEDAFPTTATARPAAMNLASTFTDHAAAKNLLAELTATDDQAETIRRSIAASTNEKHRVEEECETIIREGDATAEAAQKLTVNRVQLGLLDSKIASLEKKLAETRRERFSQVRRAARQVSEMCKPLIPQFRADLEAALRPFSKSPAHLVQVLVGNCTHGYGEIDLMNFLRRGMDVNMDDSDHTVAGVRSELCETLRRLIAGKDIWSATGRLADHPQGELEPAED